MPNMPRSPMLGFRDTTELRADLERIANDRRETLSDVIRRACEDFIRRYPLDDA